MLKNILSILAFNLLALTISANKADAKQANERAFFNHFESVSQVKFINDTLPPVEIMDIITTVVYSLNSFSIEKVADLYTPNAVIADDEPPYSWNGPTAGIQWVYAVEQVCKDIKLTKLKGTIGAINVFQQTADNVYIVVPVNYSGYLPGKQSVTSKGAFAFVLRMVNGKWLIKSQVWMAKNAL